MSVGQKPRRPIARRTPLRPSGWKKRPSGSARRKRKGRKPTAFARIYGSEARVLWVKSLPCVGCGRVPTVEAPNFNAHTVTGGTNRKADASTIAPLCHPCHVKYDQHLAPFNREDRRDAVKAHAVFTDAQWARMGDVRREA